MKARQLVLLASLIAGAVQAQHAHHGAPGSATAMPYAGMQDRAIKALSGEDRRALLNGRGSGMALAAELNGFPGPAHVLELAEPLQLTGEQRQATQLLMQAHQAEARALGAQVVDAERELDRAFAGRQLDEKEVDRLTARIGDLQARLRAAHLRTHLKQSALLTPVQVARYQQLRGYTAAAAAPERAR